MVVFNQRLWANPQSCEAGALERLIVCFEKLHEAHQKNELILVDGGMCRWHLRRDKQLTIHEIISQRPGAGSEMLTQLKTTPDATSIFAKCPADLPSNNWYNRRGFALEETETLASGREINHWRLSL